MQLDTSSTKIITNSWLILIILLGLGLRIYQLTDDPFWLDELGVWYSASKPTLQEAILESRAHVMGMPLHYVVTWFFAKIGLQNEWLRLPDTILGILSIAVGYHIARNFVQEKVALVTALLMATSPLLIRYSQELRFYAGLLFFHLLIIMLFIEAIKKPDWQHWLGVILAAVLGTLYHAYSILGFLFAFAVFWFNPNGRSWHTARILMITTICLLAFYTWAMIQFGALPIQSRELFEFETPVSFFLGGLGLAPIYSPKPMTIPYYILLTTLFTTGLISSLQTRNKWFILSPLLICCLLIAVVVAMNWYRHYFLSNRQIYFLSFWVYLVAAYGLQSIIPLVTERLAFIKEHHKEWIFGGIVALVGLCAIPPLSQYYTAERTIVRNGYVPLVEHWQRGDWICVIPDFDVTVYKFYWKDNLGAWLIPCDQQHPFQDHSIKFIIGNEDMDFSPTFREIYRPPADTFYPKRIWMRVE